MKQFLLKLSIKILCVMMILITLPFLFFILPSKPFSKTIFLGDSHFNKTYNHPDNLALGSESTFFSYLKLKQIIKKQRVDTVYLAFGYHTLSDYFIEYEDQPIILERYFPYLPVAMKIKYGWRLNYPRMIYEFGRSYLNRKNAILGRFETPPNNKFNAEKCKERTDYIYNKHDFSKSNLNGLEKIRLLCEQERIKLYLVNTPLHPTFRKNIPEKFRLKYEQVTKNFQVFHLENQLNEDSFSSGRRSSNHDRS